VSNDVNDLNPQAQRPGEVEPERTPGSAPSVVPLPNGAAPGVPDGVHPLPEEAIDGYPNVEELYADPDAGDAAPSKPAPSGPSTKSSSTSTSGSTSSKS
jgi:hypothetical protein